MKISQMVAASFNILNKKIATLEKEKKDLELGLELAVAEIKGLKAELKSLKSKVVFDQDGDIVDGY